jgi:hypothetical protein
MIRVIRRTQLAAPLEVAWAWLADLERLVLADLLHREARFIGGQRAGVGTVLLVPHGLAHGPRMLRRLTITHWQPPHRLRWTDVSVSRWGRRHIFPHSEEFRLEALDARTTLLIDTVTGALNLRVPLLGALAERALEVAVVRQIVRHQGRTLRRSIRG